jgi:uncharacterized repeat protein (TIGR02543 family)
MSRFIKISVLVAAVFAFVLTSCEKEKTFTVTFNAQGGSEVAAIIGVAKGTKIVKPNDPTKDGFVFAGWYKEAECKNIWSFLTDVVNGNITLYAKWSDNGAKPDITVELNFMNYYGDYIGVGTENFYAGFVTPEGVFYVLDMYSPTVTQEGTLFALAEGVYKFDEGSTGAAFTFGKKDSGISTDGQTFTIGFMSGEVTIVKVGNGYSVKANLVDSNDDLHTFVYNGEFLAKKITIYDEEPQTPVNITINSTKVSIADNYGDWYGVGENLYYTMIDDNNNSVTLDILADGADLTSLPAGTYPINGSFALNTVVAYTNASSALTGGSVVTYNNEYYFLVSGDVVVTSGGLVMTGISYFGSQFTLNYTGSLAIPSTMQSSNAQKSAEKSNIIRNSSIRMK